MMARAGRRAGRVGRSLLGTLPLLLALGGCDPSPRSPAGAAAGAQDLGPKPEAARFGADAGGLLFTYQGEEGWGQAERPEEVPEASRAQVVVVDLKRSPDKRGSGRWVQVANLTQLGQDGLYPVQVLPRRDWERRLRRPTDRSVAKPGAGPSGPGRPGPSPAPLARGSKPPRGRLIMYSTKYCPACKAARRFLDALKIPYVDKDIERDPAAARELRKKLGPRGSGNIGVPVFDVRGKLVRGFDKERLLALLRPR